MSPLYNEQYPGYDCLKEQNHWDEATRRLVLDRVYNVPPIRFFTDTEVEILQAVVDTVLPQDDRPPELRVPIVHYVDDKQFRGCTAGFRFEDMPPDRSAWHLGLQGIDESSRALFGGQRFVQLSPEQRIEVMAALQRGDPPGDVWKRVPAQRFFRELLMHDIVGAYYAHPFAWNEIGYGGPAYPRGYYALNHGAKEHWEVNEQR